MGSADAPGLDFGGHNGSIFEVCRRSCAFGANFVRTQQNAIKTGMRGTSELSRDETKATKNRSEDVCEAAQCSTGARTAHWESLSRAARGSFWTSPGCSWLARGAPRSALRRHLGVQKPSRVRPDASPKRPWAPKPAQDRFFVNLGWIFVDVRTIFVHFHSSRVRRRHKSRISKRSRVILSVRLGSCVV